MKRFLQAYLTIASIAVILVNLVIAILYSRQFLFHAEDGAVVESASNYKSYFVSANAVMGALFLLIWFISRKIYSIHLEDNDTTRHQ